MNSLNKIRIALQGKKSHLVGLASVLIGVLALVDVAVPGCGAVDKQQAIQMILGGLGLSAISAKINRME